MAHFEKRLSSETKFEGRVITVTLDRVELENGGTSTREVVRHHGGAGVAALNDEGEIYLVRQYRYALDRELIEIPAGKLEKGEDPLEAAKRELGEEAGLPPPNTGGLGISFPPADIAARSFTCMRPRAFLPWDSTWTRTNFSRCSRCRWTRPRKWFSPVRSPTVRP